MVLSTRYVPGAPIWADLGTPDIDAAAAFYRAVLGWGFQSFGPDMGGYGALTLDGKTVSGLGPLTESTTSAWTLYFDTADADATAELVTKAGGTVLAGPMDVATQGRMAQFTDPAGVQFAVWQPGETKGLDVVNEVGSLAWTELHTTDPAAAVAFYGDVFGWTVQEMPMGDFNYTVISPRGGDDSSGQGGIMPLAAGMGDAGLSPTWLPYFEVADCDTVVAAASDHGGSVIVPAMDIPEVGRMATLADPAGATFCVITSVAS
jgi:predicted enzyme related to lactoylglutathione lyase